MAFLHTCKTCVRKDVDCAARERMNAEARRLGISSLKHRCAEKKPLFAPGDPVLVKTIPTYDSDPEYQVPRLWFRGHFVCWSADGRPVVFVTPGTQAEEDEDWTFDPQSSGFVRVAISRVAPGSGDRRDVRSCFQCGATPGLGQPCSRDPEYFRECRFAPTPNLEACP